MVGTVAFHGHAKGGYNAADQMCWSAPAAGTGSPAYGTAFSYDGNGNTLTGDTTTGTNTWTNYNQQASTSVGGSMSYSYTGTGNTQRVTAGGVTFTNGLLGQVSAQAGGVASNEYVRDPDDNPISNTDPTGLFCDGFYECAGDGAALGTFGSAIAAGAVGGLATGGVGVAPGAFLGAAAGAVVGTVAGGVVGIAEDVWSWF